MTIAIAVAIQTLFRITEIIIPTISISIIAITTISTKSMRLILLLIITDHNVSPPLRAMRSCCKRMDIGGISRSPGGVGQFISPNLRLLMNGRFRIRRVGEVGGMIVLEFLQGEVSLVDGSIPMRATFQNLFPCLTDQVVWQRKW
jgi:hypothetical protein